MIHILEIIYPFSLVFSPTIMVAVPKIWDVIKKGVEAKVSQSPAIAQFLVKTGFEWRSFCLKNGFDSPLFKKLVFKKFKAAVGGQLRLGASGGGPLNSEVQEFCRTAFGVALVQGYVSSFGHRDHPIVPSPFLTCILLCLSVYYRD
jgi:long-subunit acyl-CoA synthetase (AMP-forming)